MEPVVRQRAIIDRCLQKGAREIGQFSITPLESSVRIPPDDLVGRSFPFPASCDSTQSLLPQPLPAFPQGHPPIQTHTLTPPSRHTPHICSLQTHILCVHAIYTDTHTCLTSWLASSWQKVLFLEAAQPPPLFSQDFHLAGHCAFEFSRRLAPTLRFLRR